MIRIITDSTSSIPADMREELGIEIASLHVHRGSTDYLEESMDLDAFYADIYEMIDDIPTSSQPSPLMLKEKLTAAAQAGDEVLALFISSKMSGTFETAVSVAAQVAAEYSDFKYVIADSLSNCLELGWPVVAAAKVRNAGGTLDECVDAMKESVLTTRFVFAPESLRFLEAGGRIGKAAALIGSLVSLSPVLTVKDGFAATHAKVRTQKKALKKIVDIFSDDMRECGLKNVIVHYIGKREPAEQWACEVVEPLIGRSVRVVPASPVIGVHVGPAMGLAYECERPLPGKFTEAEPEFVRS